MKLLATSTDRHLMHESAADAFLAHAVHLIRLGLVRVVAIPVVRRGSGSIAQVLVNPSTQLSLSPDDAPQLELTDGGRAALADLLQGTAAFEQDDSAAVGLSADEAFVDFDRYDRPRNGVSFAATAGRQFSAAWASSSVL